ncbi:hypothetical protein Mapa_008310 [Marchantia paleacea]|nr:hypothetical protein Mapa_008310 [Marchantia paleacea]
MASNGQTRPYNLILSSLEYIRRRKLWVKLHTDVVNHSCWRVFTRSSNVHTSMATSDYPSFDDHGSLVLVCIWNSPVTICRSSHFACQNAELADPGLVTIDSDSRVHPERLNLSTIEGATTFNCFNRLFIF